MAEVSRCTRLKTCYSKTGCNTQSAALKVKPLRFQFTTNAVNCVLDIRFLNMGYHDDELLSSYASAYVRRARVCFEQISKFLEHYVSRLVSVGVVHAFKGIQISHHDPESEPVPNCSTDLSYAPVFEGSTVWEASKRISKRQFL